MRLFCKRTNPLERPTREQTPRNDCVNRTRIAIFRPATAGRTAVCRFRKADCRTRCSEPGFSLSSPNAQVRRRDPAPRTDCSGMRCFRTAARQTPDVAPFLLDRSLESRCAHARLGTNTRGGCAAAKCGGTAVIPAGRSVKVLLIDSNVYFAKRLGDALKREGFEVVSSTQAAFALTTLEYDAPSAILCATNMREMGALEIARIIHADPKNANLPIVALGDGSQRALMEAFQAGCDDYIDRNRQPAVIAAHIKQILVSKAEGFQPTQMLPQSDTSLSGNLTHHDLTGVMQMLGHAHQTGALHINAGETDGVLFYDAGEIVHAECGNLFGDEAVIHILKSCVNGGAGVYKFVYGTTSPQRTVLRSATDLMLDAMREYDEGSRDMADKEAQ